MSAERISTSPSFWPRQGLVDSLVLVLGGGESKKETDPMEDPFFIFEAWLTPEYSPLHTGPLPTEEELTHRLYSAPAYILALIGEGLLAQEDCIRVFQENGLTMPNASTTMVGELGSPDLFSLYEYDATA